VSKPTKYLFDNCWELIPKTELKSVPHNTRGLYVLYQELPGADGEASNFAVVYIGMAGAKNAGIHGRLKAHAKNEEKTGLWSHFSFYQVSKEVREDQVRDLEGAIQHIYRKDPQVNILNLQKGSGKIRKIRTRYRS
jgi:hypothetical protein